MGAETERSVGDTIRQIREFAEGIERPDRWRILVPTASWDEVKQRLDTDGVDLGTAYDGITLCYSRHHDVPRAEYRAALPTPLEDEGVFA